MDRYQITKKVTLGFVIQLLSSPLIVVFASDFNLSKSFIKYGQFCSLAYNNNNVRNGASERNEQHFSIPLVNRKTGITETRNFSIERISFLLTAGGRNIKISQIKTKGFRQGEFSELLKVSKSELSPIHYESVVFLKRFIEKRAWSEKSNRKVEEDISLNFHRSTYFIISEAATKIPNFELNWVSKAMVRIIERSEGDSQWLPVEKKFNQELPGDGSKFELSNYIIDSIIKRGSSIKPLTSIKYFSNTRYDFSIPLKALLDAHTRQMSKKETLDPNKNVYFTYGDRVNKLNYASQGFSARSKEPILVNGEPLYILQGSPASIRSSRTTRNATLTGPYQKTFESIREGIDTKKLDYQRWTTNKVINLQQYSDGQFRLPQRTPQRVEVFINQTGQNKVAIKIIVNGKIIVHEKLGKSWIEKDNFNISTPESNLIWTRDSSNKSNQILRIESKRGNQRSLMEIEMNRDTMIPKSLKLLVSKEYTYQDVLNNVLIYSFTASN
ncbi:MAG: hypothetical protein AB8E15_09000 [Bdellovibrionales bacterium]